MAGCSRVISWGSFPNLGANICMMTAIKPLQTRCSLCSVQCHSWAHLRVKVFLLREFTFYRFQLLFRWHGWGIRHNINHAVGLGCQYADISLGAEGILRNGLKQRACHGKLRELVNNRAATMRVRKVRALHHIFMDLKEWMLPGEMNER